jgi:membrane protein implicated in regulation of membrane protease activity
MDHTAGPILEIGVLLLGAVAAGAIGGATYVALVAAVAVSIAFSTVVVRFVAADRGPDPEPAARARLNWRPRQAIRRQ